MWDVVIIGGGIAGLTTAHALRTRAAAEDRGVRVCLVESERRLGGKIVTERRGGFLVEGGPDSFIVQKPWALELVRELGLEDRIVPADERHRTTFVVRGGRLAALPEGLQFLVPRDWAAFERSDVVSPEAKRRIAGERDVAPRRGSGDESVAAFVRRRFGDEVLERLAEPLLAHVHVADVERMSLRATYPRLAEMEKRFGSVTAGVEAMRRRQGSGAAPAGPVFLTLRGGLAELVDELAARLPAPSRRLGRTVRRIEIAPGGDYLVRLDDGEALETRAVVLAVPAFAAAGLVESLDAELAHRLRAIRYVSLATLSLGYRRGEIAHPLAGFGFFVPRCENRTVLACTWTSSKYAGRTPDDEHVLLRAFLGGARDDVLKHDDATLVELVRNDLRDLLAVEADPVLVRLYRWPRGYPQYEVGHLDRVRAVESALPPGISIAGSPFHGVGLPDCIRSAREAARRTLERLASRLAEVDGGALAC